LTELTSGAENRLELFESGERTNYKQGVHTMEAAKIAEGYLSIFHSVMK
jgi:hypothetical protein